MSSGGNRDRADSGDRSFWSGLDELWYGDAEPPARRSALSRDEIVRTAIGIADGEGVDAVSMRRVAIELGTGAMSLYRHVPDKDALLSFMLDAVLGEEPIPEDMPSGDWRSDLRRVADISLEMMRRHPWYPEVSMTRPPFTPNAIAGLELSLSVLDGLGLDIFERMQLVGSLHGAILNATANRVMEERQRARMDLTEDELRSTFEPYARRIMESGRYPRVSELFMRMEEHMGEDHDSAIGIDLVLDGIAARVEAARADASRDGGRRPDGAR